MNITCADSGTGEISKRKGGQKLPEKKRMDRQVKTRKHPLLKYLAVYKVEDTDN